ncbi:TWiK family of potassium channels protein 9-like [Lineus longissimus]|uniref:TWiK family of potassium channels protein 9-like n=1 Tax=Lineus longissimus TaxID=88925 RepID=UPI00315DB736
MSTTVSTTALSEQEVVAPTVDAGAVQIEMGDTTALAEAPRVELMMDEKAAERARMRREHIRKVKICCQKFWAFLFSHIGLSGLVVGYSIMGGFLFQALEAPKEKQAMTDMLALRNDTIEDITEKAMKLFNQREVLRTNVLQLIKSYEEKLIKSVKENGWDGINNLEETKWTYAGALLFAVTVITTIGYGHVAPKTNAGRIVTILYALVGIPLTFLCLANIGDFLADCFRWMYSRICCGLCCLLWAPPKKRQRRMRELEMQQEAKELAKEQNKEPGSTNKKDKRKGSDKKKDMNKSMKVKKRKSKSRKEDRNRDSGLTETSLLELCDETQQQHEANMADMDADLAETEFQDIMNQYEEFKNSQISLADTKIHLKDEDVIISVDQLFTCKETDLTNLWDHNAPTEIASDADDTLKRSKFSRKKRSSRRRRNRRKDKRWKSDTEIMFKDLGRDREKDSERDGCEKYSEGLEVLDRDYDDTKSNKVDISKVDIKKVRVPISLCLLVILLYILAGALLFSRWESWDPLTGSYFCFVTLSTIGFGDIVPGTQLDAWESQEKLVACAMYLALGLSVLAMCFNLMQEEVKEKCRWLARKVGILEDD